MEKRRETFHILLLKILNFLIVSFEILFHFNKIIIIVAESLQSSVYNGLVLHRNNIMTERFLLKLLISRNFINVNAVATLSSSIHKSYISVIHHF